MKQKRGQRTAIAFAATVIVLLGVLVYLDFPRTEQVPLYGIPDNLPFYGGVLRHYVPLPALEASFDNLTLVRQVNSSLFYNNLLLSLENPNVTITSSTVTARLTVAFDDPNATVTALFLTQTMFSDAQALFEGSGSPSQAYSSYTLYTVKDTTGKTPVGDWVTLVPANRSILYSQGALDANQALKKVLDTVDGHAKSILEAKDIARMVYAANGTVGHAAFGIQNFTGAVGTGLKTVIAVDARGGNVSINYVVRFNGTEFAQTQITQIKSVYLGAQTFAIYDENVRATEKAPYSYLRTAIGIVG